MAGKKPAKLSGKALDRCATIASVKQRDIFDAVLTKLVVGSCRYPVGADAARKARSKVVKTGRTFVKAVREATPATQQEIEVWFPYGTIACLEIALDNMAPSLRSAKLRNRTFVTLLCVAIKNAGGHVTLNEESGEGTLIDLLVVLKPYLPENFTALSTDTLGRAKGQATHLSKHVRY
jgi:hypothetical protein